MSYSKNWEDFLRGKPVDPNKLEPIPDAPQVSSLPELNFGAPWESDEGDENMPPMGMGPIVIISGPHPFAAGFPGPEQFPHGQPIVIRRSLAEEDFREFLECASGFDVPGYPRAPTKGHWKSFIVWASLLTVGAAIAAALFWSR